MNLFFKILATVSTLASFGYLTFYRTGIVDSMLVATILFLSSFMLGADIFYNQGFNDGFDYGLEVGYEGGYEDGTNN